MLLQACIRMFLSCAAVVGGMVGLGLLIKSSTIKLTNPSHKRDS